MIRYMEETVSADVWRRFLRLVQGRIEDMLPGQVDVNPERIIWREFRAHQSWAPLVPVGSEVRAQAAEHLEVLR